MHVRDRKRQIQRLEGQFFNVSVSADVARILSNKLDDLGIKWFDKCVGGVTVTPERLCYVK